MIGINQVRQRIKDELEQAFTEAGMTPLIDITTFPVSESGNAELEKEAVGCADNGAIYIGRMPRHYGERIGGIYAPKDPYLIMIYSNDSVSDEAINNYFDVARARLFIFMTLISDYVCDVKGYKSGLYMAWILVEAPESLYMGG